MDLLSIKATKHIHTYKENKEYIHLIKSLKWICLTHLANLFFAAMMRLQIVNILPFTLLKNFYQSVRKTIIEKNGKIQVANNYFKK